ncbi:amidohydrolase family protein [Pedobacter petrophilus]|uniref:Amidohydrolase family protein n=1 Tax=Pedobacter petrophilus TaxID=1908241 RepID=A0A7K0G1P1_9SPHI|nr:dihydroorotase [Pedobacter petrophilus]MRX77757.1 amidohydrolase family protein [Pedobacter petrophilus]
MNLLVKNVIIADPQSSFNKQECDVRVVDGQIQNIGKLTANQDETVFKADGAFLTPGFFDLNCVAGDPGFETKEDIQTLTNAAKAGGFTGLALLPQANPVVQSKSQVEYIINKAKNNLVDVLPVGAISQNREAKELAELFDMQQAGAVAFSDGDRALQDDGFMSRALQYAKGFDALLMVYPENKSIAGKSQINESKNSVLLGMKGLPALAEEMHIARDLFLATYNETKIHISNISTAGSVALIRKAKKDGVQVSCDVTAHHLVFTEELLVDFDSNYKVKPPLRSKADIKALIAGLKDGTVDAITSQHRPEEIEFKNVEFEIAHYGIIALQTVLPLLLRAGLDASLIAEKLSINPRKLLNLAVPVIAEGEKANFTVINPTEKWLYNAKTNFSKSANSPLLGTELTGKVVLIYNNNQFKES